MTRLQAIAFMRAYGRAKNEKTQDRVMANIARKIETDNRRAAILARFEVSR